MIMQNEYLDDIIDHLRNMVDDDFTRRGTTRQAVLGNQNILDRLWTVYQKDVEDYDCDRDFALDDAVNEVLSPLPMREYEKPDAKEEPEEPYYLLSWNEEYLDLQIECGPTSIDTARQAMHDAILTRLVELDLAGNIDEAGELYERAEKAAADQTGEPYELHVGKDSASIAYDVYGEYYQIKPYKPTICV